MSLPGYDAWKTRLPEDDWRECPHCDGVMRWSSFWRGWECERCEENTGPDPDALYDEWRDRQMEEGR